MTIPESLDPGVLGRILLLQSSLSVAPDEQRLGEMVSRALSGVPGVAACEVYFGGGTRVGDSADRHRRWFPLETSTQRYGTIDLHLTEASAFAPYEAFVGNAANVVALQIESTRNAAAIKRLNLELDGQVRQRTRELAATAGRLEHLNRVLAAIRNVNQLITQESDRDRLLARACDLLAETGGYHNAWIALIGPDGACGSCSQSGLNGQFDPMIAFLREGRLPACAELALASDTVQVRFDPEQECADCPLARAYSGRSGLSMRLAHAGRVFGWLSVSLPGQAAADEEERGLLEEVCGDIGFALWTMELREQTQATQRRYESVLDSAADAIIATDLDGRISVFSPGAERLFNLSAEDAIGSNIRRFCPEDLAKESDLLRGQTREQGMVQGYETERLTADGQRIPVELTLSLTADGEGNAVGLTGILRNITQRRRAREELRYSEEKYKALYDNAPLCYQSLDERGCFVDVNPAWLQTLGYERDKVIGHSFAEFLPPVERSRFKETFAGFVARGFVHDVQYRLMRKDGEFRDVSFEGRVGCWPDGRFRQTYCVFQDITERKLAERARLESEANLSALIENTDGMIWSVDRDCRMLAANSAFARHMTGVMGRAFGSGECVLAESFSPAVLEAWKTNYDRALRGESFSVEAQAELVSPAQYMEYRFAPIRTQEGTVGGATVYARDVTERRRAEEVIRESERRLNEAEQLSHLGSWTMNIASGKSTWSDEFYRICGYEPGDFAPTSEIGMNLIHTDDRERAAAAVSRSIETGIPYDIEKRIVRPDGSVRWVHSKGRVAYDSEGSPDQLIGSFLDITDRKEAEAALHSSEEQQKLILNSASELIIYHDLDMRIVWANRAAAESVNRNPKELVGKFCYDVWNTTGEPCIGCPVVQARDTGSMCANDVRTPDGRHWSVWGHPAFDQEGQLVGLVESAVDITEQHQVNVALRESEQRFRQVYENMSVGVARISLDFVIKEANQAYCKMLGYTEQELAGLPLADITHPETLVENMRLQEALGRGEIEHYRMEKRFLHKSGADVYGILDASLVRDEEGAPAYFLGTVIDISQRRQAEQERERLLSAIEQADESILITDTDWVIQYVNPALEAVSGYGREELLGSTPRVFGDEESGFLLNQDVAETLARGEVWRGRFVNRRKDGSSFTEDAVISPVRDARGRIVNYVAVQRDVTKELLLEEQLRQAQKMESVGRLAGGVAHDFNNMLSVILGYAELALDHVDRADPLYDDINEIEKAAERSSELTQQLLAFARRQAVAPRVLDPNETISGMISMLGRLIGEDIELSWIPCENPWRVCIDPTQVHQILANLCVNARDAIGGVGRLTIETSNVAVDDDYASGHAEVIAGEYVLLTISDTGCGMDDETLRHVFEPFFTTKAQGKGTGLGLATVYGTVRQNGGFLNVYSEVGVGTTFRIYLPRHLGSGNQTDERDSRKQAERGLETVLLVEDEPAILHLIQNMLEKQGYTVLCASSPGEAIDLALGYSGKIHLLITDVVMPEMNGRDLARRLLSVFPDIKRLFMSGYTADVIAHNGILDGGVAFLAKPFSRADLATEVRRALDAD